MALSKMGGLGAVLVEKFMEGVGSVPDDWRQFVDYKDADVPSLKVSPMSGAGDPTSWNGTDSLSSAHSTSISALTAKDYSYQQYAAQITIARSDISDIPGVVQDAVAKLGFSVANTYAKLAFTTLMNGVPGAGPGDGSVTTADGKKLFADDHTTAAGTSRSNYAATTLTGAGDVMAAITMARNWENYQNQPYDLNSGGWALCVPPALEATAAQAVGSQYTSDQLQINVAGSYGINVITSAHLQDETAWFLMSRGPIRPVVFWERLPVRLDIVEDQDTLATKINCDFAVVSDANAQPDGGFGFNAA